MKKVIFGLSALALVSVSSICLADDTTQNPNQNQATATQQGTDTNQQASTQNPANNKQTQNQTDTQKSDDNADLD
jgi:hypothetical protein